MDEKMNFKIFRKNDVLTWELIYFYGFDLDFK